MTLFGRPRDFERAVKGELEVLYRVARRMGCSPEESEDLVQTCLMKAHQAWDRFDGSHLRSWLIRILRNERLMLLRERMPDMSLDEDGAPEPIEPSFWAQTAARLDAAAIIRALDELPEAYRLAVQLCDVEEMSYEEAAGALDVPIGTIRSRLFRGRTMLRETLMEDQR